VSAGTGPFCTSLAAPPPRGIEWVAIPLNLRDERTGVKYVSTRGAAPILGFDDVVLAGLARDGGLYVPQFWPRLSDENLRAMAQLNYPALTARVMAPFAVPAIAESELRELAVQAYAGFDHAQVAPLKRLYPRLWLLELFHGPTLAFKDFALQILGRLFDLILKRRGERVTIVGATSGDTGSAAIEACRGRDAIDIFILHPRGRVSEVQRRQMTTVDAPNVHNIAVEGTFDDCQDLVKAMFNDAAFRDEMNLAAVNSINWARILAQITYYVYASLALGGPGQPVAFAVPTGNFGNVFAAYAARCLGAPIAHLIVGSNRNDILTRFFASGRMEMGEVFPTLSPSMDIQISSNFERLLFELYDRDGTVVARLMDTFKARRAFQVDTRRWQRATGVFSAFRIDDSETSETIRTVYAETGELLDPHSAIGVAAARSIRTDTGIPVIAVATAHPAKFPDAVEAATGQRPALPPRLAELMGKREHCVALPADLAAIEAHIVRCVGAADGARP
jgi:threonine synthase